jgi:hypothetical protein
LIVWLHFKAMSAWNSEESEDEDNTGAILDNSDGVSLDLEIRTMWQSQDSDYLDFQKLISYGGLSILN